MCGDNRIRVHDRVRNKLRTFGPDGAELEPVALPLVRLTSVSPRQFGRAVFPLREAEITGAVGRELTPADSVRALNEMAQALQGTPEQLAAHLPRYVDLRCGDDGDVWMQPFDLDRGGLAGGPAWLRVAPDGATDEVHMPVFDPYRFTDGRIWANQVDGSLPAESLDGPKHPLYALFRTSEHFEQEVAQLPKFPQAGSHTTTGNRATLTVP